MSNAMVKMSHKIIRAFTYTGYLNPISLKLEWSIFRILRPTYFTKTCSEDLQGGAEKPDDF